jgi:hypothetical protein
MTTYGRTRADYIQSKNFRDYVLRFWRRCQWCNAELNELTATTDHVIPQTQKGSWEWENLVLACVGCNSRKGGRILDAWHLGPRWSRSHLGVSLRFAPSMEWTVWVSLEDGSVIQSLSGKASVLCQQHAKAILRGHLVANAVEVRVMPVSVELGHFEARNFPPMKCRSQKQKEASA